MFLIIIQCCSLRIPFTKTQHFPMVKRKRSTDDDYNPKEEATKKRKKQRSRRSAQRRRENSKRTTDQIRRDNSKKTIDQIRRNNSKRTTDQIRRENSKRTTDQIRRANSKRTKEQIRKQNSKRPRLDAAEMTYDIASPFPPTKTQVKLCGQILSNSIAAMFSQQTPSPEISYAVVVAEQLKAYTRPIIDFAMHQFRNECCFRSSGDLNFSKAAANKALSTLDKMLLMNEHHQLMSDFEVWDVFNAPSLNQLKQLSTRHPYQPISESLKNDIDSYKKQIHKQLISIMKPQHDDCECNEDERFDDDEIPSPERLPSRYAYPHCGKYCRLENSLVRNVVGGKLYHESNAKDFNISINEAIAFHINSEAKFAKVYREGASFCFLMPVEFKDDVIRDFFAVKFEDFVTGEKTCIMKDDEHSENLIGCRSSRMLEKVDFGEENLERRKVEQGCAKDTGDVYSVEVDAEAESPVANNDILSNFIAQVKKAQKHVVDADDVCLIE